MFVVGTPKGAALPDLPEATHSGSWERPTIGGGGRPHVSAAEALAGQVSAPESEETVRGRWGHLLADIPPGDNDLFDTAERGRPDPVFEWRRYRSLLVKLSPDR